MKAVRKGRSRPPLTREWLLPLPPAHVRDISLKCHMALVALRGEHGSEALLMRLRTSVYLVFLALDDAVSGSTLELEKMGCCGNGAALSFYLPTFFA